MNEDGKCFLGINLYQERYRVIGGSGSQSKLDLLIGQETEKCVQVRPALHFQKNVYILCCSHDSPGTQRKSTNECHRNWVGPVSAELVYQVLDAS